MDSGKGPGQRVEDCEASGKAGGCDPAVVLGAAPARRRELRAVPDSLGTGEDREGKETPGADAHAAAQDQRQPKSGDGPEKVPGTGRVEPGTDPLGAGGVQKIGHSSHYAAQPRAMGETGEHIKGKKMMRLAKFIEISSKKSVFSAGDMLENGCNERCCVIIYQVV